MSNPHLASTERFSIRVENYIKYRPGYPKEIVEVLVEECGLSADSVIADIGSGTGSGVILDPNGYIVTNAYVVEGARRIQVVLAKPITAKKPRYSILKSRGTVVGAQVAGIDQETDLAVLKINEKGDVIHSINNNSIENLESLRLALEKLKSTMRWFYRSSEVVS